MSITGDLLTMITKVQRMSLQSAHSAADHRLLAPGTALLLCVPPGEGGCRLLSARRSTNIDPHHATALNILLSELTLI